MYNPEAINEFIASLRGEALEDALAADPLGARALDEQIEAEEMRELLFDILAGRPSLFNQLREDNALRRAQEMNQMWLPLGKGEF